jgi:manganese/zinc/iron transport system permease protein
MGRVEHLDTDLRWDPEFAEKVVRQAERRGLVLRLNCSLALTEPGRRLAQRAIVS